MSCATAPSCFAPTTDASRAYWRDPCMRLPNAAHESRPWRIREITPDFRLEDVWALPAHGRADDFPKLIEVMGSLDPTATPSSASRALFDLRFRLGRCFGWDNTTSLPIPGSTQTTL